MNPQIDVDPVCDGNTLPASNMGKRVSQKSKNEFAALLRAWRESLGVSQSQGAAILGIESKRTLQNWEIARTAPTGVTRKILEAQFKAQLAARRRPRRKA